MEILLLRHGETAYNAERRYQGQRDIPLSPAGRAALHRAGFAPDTVYVSPLRRATETAAVLFPTARQVVVQEFRVMSFGVFEGRQYVHMERDPEFLAAAGEEGVIPGGERRADFCDRTCAAFSALVDEGLREGRERLVIVAHGDTQMAVLSRFAWPHRDYHDWCAPNGGGFRLKAEPEPWHRAQILRLSGTVQYTKELP